MFDIFNCHVNAKKEADDFLVVCLVYDIVIGRNYFSEYPNVSILPEDKVDTISLASRYNEALDVPLFLSCAKYDCGPINMTVLVGM